MKRIFDDLTGRKFERLLVIKRIENDNLNRPRWLCSCICGNKVEVNGNNLKSGNTTIVSGKELRNNHTCSCGCSKESAVATRLKKHLKIKYDIIPEYKIIQNPKTRQWLRYDIYIKNNIFIEVHGIQHYKFICFFHTTQDNFESQKYRDRIKKKYAKKNGTYIEVDLRKIKTTEQAIEYVENIINKL